MIVTGFSLRIFEIYRTQTVKTATVAFNSEIGFPPIPIFHFSKWQHQRPERQNGGRREETRQHQKINTWNNGSTYWGHVLMITFLSFTLLNTALGFTHKRACSRETPLATKIHATCTLHVTVMALLETSPRWTRHDLAAGVVAGLVARGITRIPGCEAASTWGAISALL